MRIWLGAGGGRSGAGGEPCAAGRGRCRTAASPCRDVARELQAKGYKAEIGKDSGGDPKITSGMDGTNFTVWFYGCKDGRCTQVQYEAGFDLKSGLSLAKINLWNRENRFGAGHLDDENDPYIQYDIDFEHGATTEAIANTIDVWASLLPDFKKFIDF
jgi:hypothetical protein